MSKLLVVFGATGQQGSSIINHVLSTPTLSSKYKIRGISRDPSSAPSVALKAKGISIVRGDPSDFSSLQTCLEGAHTVFIMTVSLYTPTGKAEEIAQGEKIADTAISSGAQYLIYSSVPYASQVSGGKYTGVDVFDAKGEVEQYIRALPISSAFFSVGGFMQNIQRAMKPKANPAGDGTYMLSHVVRPETKMAMIDTAEDSGKFVGAILEQPEEWEGKTVVGASENLSFRDMAGVIGKVSGKTVVYNQLDEEVFKKSLPAALMESYVQMIYYIQDFGYFGLETEELIREVKGKVQGLSSFEDYLRRNPIES
ncbi:hypothetical protein B7494_g7338 [Chlorociboria aeruginascens]|nr:hypothetical protein B7494_g7338 [Chlorociboria aeruginascens]